MLERLTRIVVGSLLLLPLVMVATPPPAQAVVAQDLRFACASKNLEILTYATGPSSCGSGETFVTFTVTNPRTICVRVDPTKRLAARLTCKTTPKGILITLPSNTPQYFCVKLGGNKRLLYVTDPNKCLAGETLFVVVNHAPTDIALSDNSVDENVPVGTVVGTLSATDQNPDDAHTFSLVPGTGDSDNAAFWIVDNELRTNAAVDFESQSSYSIRLAVTDLLGLSYEEVFTITVNDIAENDPPTDISLSNDTVAENQPVGTNVGTLTTTDPDPGDTHTYSLVTEAGVPNNNDLFQISGDQLQTAAPLDHEGAGPTYVVTIQTDDGNGGTYVESFTITATDANDPPSAIALSNDSVAENQPASTNVGQLSATDEDAGASHTFSLVAGAGDEDNASFQISGDTLQTSAVFDFEADSSKSIRVRADDGAGGTFEQVLTVTITDANDAPSDITLNPDTVTEGQPAGTTIGTLSATDQDPGDTHTFTLVAGAGDEDNAKVTIDGTTLKTAAVIDFGTDPVLKVRVRADDGNGGTFEEALIVTVVNVNNPPTDIALDNATVAENEPVGTTVGSFSTVDEPGDTHTYTLVAGAGSDDNGSFIIDGASLKTSAVFDFEADSSLTIRVRSTDQDGATTEKIFLITVTDANDAPTDITLNNSSVDENQPSGTNVGDLFATDPDVGDTHTFSLVAGPGDADNASFQIVGNTLKTNAVFNFEVKNSYTIRVAATDSGGSSFEKVFTISINDINDAPVAAGDTYNGAIGNTLAVLGTTASGPNVVLTGNVVLANDSDEDGDTLSAVAETVTSTGGGTATINGDGSFTFLPGVGDKNQSDTFTYHVTDGSATSAGTVTVGISNNLVWYVNAAAGAGDGRSSSPLNTLVGVNGAGGSGDSDGIGDWIFLYSGSYGGGLPLEASQNLYGEPAGLEVAGHSLVAPGGTNPVIGNAGGAGIVLAEGTAVRAVNVNGTSGAGISANGVNNATVGGTPGGVTSVSNASGAAISVTGGSSGGIHFTTSVTNTVGRSVHITNRSGDVNFNGLITDTGTGVELTNNSGSQIVFWEGVILSTGASDAFVATGGGTVGVQGPFNNSITTTTGTALRVQNTTISVADLDFRSINSNGATNGIVLQNTGSLGNLVVHGNSAGTCGGSVTGAGNFISGPDLADCTGGSILNSTGTGILLSQTFNVSLTRMRIAGNGGDGIGGTSLTGGFTLSASAVTNNGNAAEENGIDLGDSAALTPQGVTGITNILNSTVTGSADSNVIIQNSSGNSNLLIDHSRIANADSAVGATQDNIQVEASGSAVIALMVNSNSLAAAKGDQVQVNAANGAGGGGTFTSAWIANNRMTGGAPGALAQGVTVSAAGQSPLWSGSVKYDVNFNVINGAVTHAVTVALGASGAGGSFNGFVRNNQIGTTGQALSCSTQGNGIFHKAEGSGTSTIQIHNNTIRRCYDRGIQMAARDGNGVLNATVNANTVTEMSDTNAIQGTPREAFLIEAGSTSTNIIGGVDNHTVCLGLSSNSLTGGAFKTGDIRARQRFQTRVNMPGYLGTAFDTAAVVSYLQGNNPGATATAAANNDAAVTTDGYFNTAGGAACPLPTP